MPQKYAKQPSRYRILGLVGRGQFGRVFCARNRKTGQLVALKELEHQRFPTSKFLRELRFLLSLQHENIVSCLALEHKPHSRYLVMDYCEAGTLRDLINRQGYLVTRHAMSLVLDILAGLEHAHKSNIIHCDIKPENVLLKLTSSGWVAKVSDFGIARLAQEVTTMDSNNTGSPGYMAPERFYGQFSIASDLYAVGIILYELLLNERPFSGQPDQLRAAHINQRVRFPEGIPTPLKVILTKSLEKLPVKRFASASQMRQALIDVCNSLDIASLDLMPLLAPEVQYQPQDPVLLSTASAAVVEHLSSDRICHLAADASDLYSVSGQEVKQQSLSSLASLDRSIAAYDQSPAIAKFDREIIGMVTTDAAQFVVTHQGIHILNSGLNSDLGKQHESFQCLSDPISDRFYWAISPQGNWIATVAGSTLTLRNLVHPKVTKLEFGDRFSGVLVPLDQNHLAAIVPQPNGQASQIVVISRRGNLMWQFSLPTTVSRAVLSKVANRLLLVNGLHPQHLLLVDLKPYRIHRIDLERIPGAIAATTWGYAIASNSSNSSYNSDRTASSTVSLFDFEGQCVGNLIVAGEVTAIASLSISTLAIAIDRGGEHKLWLVDLSQLDIDLIF